jgi:hypothetical protein
MYNCSLKNLPFHCLQIRPQLVRCQFKVCVCVWTENVNLILVSAYSEDHLLFSINVCLSGWNKCIQKIRE